MFKFLKKVLILAIILVLSFIALSIESGGKRLRDIGDFFHKSADEAAETADLIKESSDNLRTSAAETSEALKRTGEQIKDTSEKVNRTLRKTGESLGRTADGIRNTTESVARAVKETGEHVSDAASTDDLGR